MQEFLTNNKVSCNLMSLTGYRTLVILEALMESPKSNDEINDCLLRNQYIKEKFSPDTLRIYLNSLRAIGCEITRANKSNNKYTLLSHPFDYDISKPQLKALSKLYKNIYDKIDVKEAIILESFFEKISQQLKNENTKDFLQKLQLLKNIDKKLISELLLHCKNKNQIIFSYNSPKSGTKNIEIIADKLSFKSEKLYLWGNNLTHEEYSYFAVNKIIKICGIKFSKTDTTYPPIKITYEIYDIDYVLEFDEKIIEKTDEKLIIEADAQNEFSIMQRILYLGDNCKIIEPESFKEKLLNKLNKMGKNYEDI